MTIDDAPYIAVHPSDLDWTPHPTIPRTWVMEDGITLFVFPPQAPVEVLIPRAKMHRGQWKGMKFVQTTTTA